MSIYHILCLNRLESTLLLPKEAPTGGVLAGWPSPTWRSPAPSIATPPGVSGLWPSHSEFHLLFGPRLVNINNSSDETGGAQLDQDARNRARWTWKAAHQARTGQSTVPFEVGRGKNELASVKIRDQPGEKATGMVASQLIWTIKVGGRSEQDIQSEPELHARSRRKETHKSK